MRHGRQIEIVQRGRDHRRVVVPGDKGERWSVPIEYTARVDEPSAEYVVTIDVAHDPATHLAEIVRLIVERRGGQPVHATGLRRLHLAQMLKDCERAAASFETLDDELGVFVVDETRPTKHLPRRKIVRLTDPRSRANSITRADVELAVRIVEELRSRRVKDWVERACQQLDISRATLYRRLEAANYSADTRPTKPTRSKTPAKKKPTRRQAR